MATDASQANTGEAGKRAKQANWIAERILWAVLIAVVALAIAGILGGGVASTTTARSASDQIELEVTYARWSRTHSPLEMRVAVDAPEAEGPLSLTFSSAFLDNAGIESIEPEPSSSRLAGGAMTYEWDVDDWSAPVTVRINYRAETWPTFRSSLEARAGETANTSVEMRQFALP